MLPEDECQKDKYVSDISDVDSEAEGVEDMVDGSGGHHQPGVHLREGEMRMDYDPSCLLFLSYSGTHEETKNCFLEFTGSYL